MERRPQDNLNRVDGRLAATEIACWFLIKHLSPELRNKLNEELNDTSDIGTEEFQSGLRNCVDFLLGRD